MFTTILSAVRLRPVFFLLLGVALLNACAATPTRPAEEPGVSFNYPLEKVHAAALSSLSEHGFEVVTDQITYVEGKRPHKVGLVVGSGGETIGVWLSDEGDNKTMVQVDTAKSFVGMAGQKDWDDEVISSISTALDGAS